VRWITEIIIEDKFNVFYFLSVKKLIKKCGQKNIKIMTAL